MHTFLVLCCVPSVSILKSDFFYKIRLHFYISDIDELEYPLYFQLRNMQKNGNEEESSVVENDPIFGK